MLFSKKPHSTMIMTALGLLIATVALGQAAAPAPATLLKPEPIKQEGRFMPAFGSDGLARISYTVKEDGTTDDVEVTGYLSNQFLTKSLRQSVEKWTFKPGTVDGKAVSYFNQQYLFVSRMDPNAPPPPAQVATGSRQAIKESKKPAKPDKNAAPPAPVDPSQVPLALSTKAKEAIDAAYDQMKNKENDKALKTLDEVSKKDLHTVYDFSLINQLRGSALVANNQPFEALQALELATMNMVNSKGEKVFFLEDKLLEQALRQKYLLAITLRHNALALETYQLLQEKSHPATDDKIHEQVKAVKALLDSPDPLTLLAKITSDNGEWGYVPARRIFTVADVKGKLEKITAHCERLTRELKYVENVDWTLPASWGACSLVFAGDTGTQFSVYEFSK